MTESAAKVPTKDDALKQAAAWFREYGHGHSDWDKAKRNFDREAFCLGALHVSAQPAQQPLSDLVRRARTLLNNLGRDWRDGEQFLRGSTQNHVNLVRELADRIEALEAAQLEQRHRAQDAESMVMALEAAAAQPEREAELVKALTECSDELSDLVEHYYEKTKDHPSELRRYERDIEPVVRARALLAAYTPAKDERREEAK